MDPIAFTEKTNSGLMYQLTYYCSQQTGKKVERYYFTTVYPSEASFAQLDYCSIVFMIWMVDH